MPEQPADFVSNSALGSASRATLRREKIALRQTMSAADHHQASNAILSHLESLLMPRTAGMLAFCWPVRGEVDCRPLATRLIDQGWQAAMPTVEELGAPMCFRAWSPDSAMTTDPHGIPVPLPSPPCHPDILLLPLVAFDAAGYRLGYGGGYFDRTLAMLAPRPLTVGVGFDCCRVTTIEPAPHDIPLAVIVTESGVRHFTAS